jgi:hypothetical protein
MPGKASVEGSTSESILEAKSFEDIKIAVEQSTAEDAARPKSLDEMLLHTFRVVDRTQSPPRIGEFTSEIPTVDRRLRYAQMRGSLAGGVAWESLPPEDQELITSIAACTYYLKASPDWFDDPLGTRIPHVVLGVGQEVIAHQLRFFRAVAKASESDEGRPAVEITTVVGIDS